MAKITLGNIMWAAVFMAFILPMGTLLTSTLPPPTGISANTLANMTSVSNNINASFTHTFNSLDTSLLGSGNGFNPGTSGIAGLGIFVVNGFSTVMLAVVQIPLLDFQALNFFVTGMSGVLPFEVVALIAAGVYLLYVMMAVSMLLLGVSLLEKYSVMDG